MKTTEKIKQHKYMETKQCATKRPMEQRENQIENKKSILKKMKIKIQVSKGMGCSKCSSKRVGLYLKNQKKSYII